MPHATQQGPKNQGGRRRILKRVPQEQNMTSKEVSTNSTISPKLRGGKMRAGDITLTLQCWARDVSKMRLDSPFRHYIKFTPNNTFQWYFRGTVNPRDSDSRHSLGTHNARNPSSWYFRGLYPFSPRWRNKTSQAPPRSYFWRGVSSDWVLVPRCTISCTERWQSHCGSCCSWDGCLFH